MRSLAIVPHAVKRIGVLQSPVPASGLQAFPGRQMALTFDDLPAHRAPGVSDERIDGITRALLEVLARHRASAIGFVNAAKLYQILFRGEPETPRWVQDIVGIEEWRRRA